MASSLEVLFKALWEQQGYGIDLVEQVTIIEGRKFKFDFVQLESKVVIELQGQIWHKGRHNTGTGLVSSYEKLNLATFYGYSCFQLSKEMITKPWLDIIATNIINRLTIAL